MLFCRRLKDLRRKQKCFEEHPQDSAQSIKAVGMALGIQKCGTAHIRKGKLELLMDYIHHRLFRLLKTTSREPMVPVHYLQTIRVGAHPQVTARFKSLELLKTRKRQQSFQD